MKKLITILLLSISMACYSTNYYISNTGDDAEAGTSEGTAWLTIAKVNTEWNNGTFVPGDSILFKRGDIWKGTIVIKESGTSGNPMTISAYGSGEKPIITGFDTLSSWSVHAGSVYKATFSDAEYFTNMVVVDGKQVGVGRYPDEGSYLSYSLYSTNVSITDAGVGDSPDWDNAHIVIHKSYWNWERDSITDHTNDIYTYSPISGSSETPSGSADDYYICNDLKTLTVENEWYHDFSGTTFYIYGDPSGKDVYVAELEYLIENTSGYDYITIDNIKFEGCIIAGVLFEGMTSHTLIQNCEFVYMGKIGADYESGSDRNILDNEFSYCNRAGYYENYVNTSMTIEDNYFHHIGLIMGQDTKSYLSSAIYYGIFQEPDCQIRYNVIDSVGYNGIHPESAAPFNIQYNYITNFGLVSNDGGAIYCSGATIVDRVIDHNICLYGGVDGSTYITNAIYLDAYASGVVVTNNTVGYTEYNGFMLNCGDTNTFRYNTAFDNELLNYSFSVGGGGVITGQIFEENIGVQKAGNLVLGCYFDQATTRAMGTWKWNRYMRPIDDTDHIYYPSIEHTLAEWQTYCAADSKATGTPTVITSDDDMSLTCNTTKADKFYILSEGMYDARGVYHSGVIKIKPFESIILIGDGTITDLSNRLVKYGSSLVSF